MVTNLLPMLADPELPADVLAEMEQLNADAAVIDL